MSKLGVIGVLAVLCSLSVAVQAQAKPSIGSEMQKQLAAVERQVVPAAEAMPESKFNFAPTQGEFKGVRNFGEEVKHIASISYVLCSAITGETAPGGRAGEEGPASMTTKAEAVNYLKDAFSYCSKAYATLDANTALEPARSPVGESTRLGLAALNNAHCLDHYGQMVVYLRMNGIVPPASRPRK